ncbi:putative metalloprotease CJM1_0395 family protein [Shewanella saliphila]
MSAVSVGGASVAPHKLDASKHSSAGLTQSTASSSTVTLSTASVSTSVQTSLAQPSHSSVSAVLSSSRNLHVATAKAEVHSNVTSTALPPSINREVAQPLSGSYSLKSGPKTVAAVLQQATSSGSTEPVTTRYGSFSAQTSDANTQIPYQPSLTQQANTAAQTPVNIFAAETNNPATADEAKVDEQAQTDAIETMPSSQASSADPSTQVEDETSEQSAKQQEIDKQIEQKQQQIELAEAAQIAELAKRDVEVKTHEQAHAAVGGSLAQSPSYEYEKGPDGRRYAVDGEVSIDVSTVAGDPQATLTKMQKVYAAAMAPVQPSMADIRVAAQALQNISEAKQALAVERQQSVMTTEESQKIIELGDVFADSDAEDPLAPFMNKTTEASSVIDNLANNITNEAATKITQVTSSQSTLTANAQSDVVSPSQTDLSDSGDFESAAQSHNAGQHRGYQNAIAANDQYTSYTSIAFYV